MMRAGRLTWWVLAALLVGVVASVGAFASSSPFLATVTTTGVTADTTVSPTSELRDPSASTTTMQPTTTAPGPSDTGETVPGSTTTLEPHPDADTATLESVVDGDTIRVRLPDGSIEKVRLIGIDTPEIGECFADEATAALTALLDGGTLTMSTDVSDRDRYGRLLRYLWLDDGTFVNAVLVEHGFALARDYPPDSAYAAELAAAGQRAKERGLGLWAPDACGTPVDVPVAILEIVYDAPGNDNENLNGEWVTIRNDGGSPVPLGSWILKDESASHRYQFPPGFVLDVGATVTVYTGCGSDTAATLYWCSGSGAVWNNSGDTAFLLDPSGAIVDSLGY